MATAAAYASVLLVSLTGFALAAIFWRLTGFRGATDGFCALCWVSGTYAAGIGLDGLCTAAWAALRGID
jgi:hypothetical protein